jgi:hypothetical protein
MGGQDGIVGFNQGGFVKKQRGEGLAEAFIGLVLLAVSGLVWLAIDTASCYSQARKMGFNSSWGPLQGCMVEFKPGKWIAIERYRAVDE